MYEHIKNGDNVNSIPDTANSISTVASTFESLRSLQRYPISINMHIPVM